MTKRDIAGLILMLVFVVGCAKTLPPAQVLPVDTTPPAVELRQPTPEELETEPILENVHAAVERARVYPTKQGFRNAMMRYRYRANAVYLLPTAVDHLSAIHLEPGERLYGMKLADTKRWVFDESFAGEGATRQWVGQLKPTREGLRTNMLLTTNLGVYLVELVSNRRTYLPAISWSHAPRPKGTPMPSLPLMTAQRYQARVMSETQPRWMVESAWDDGRHVWIRCADALGSTKAPAVWVVSPAGEQMVNVQLTGTVYRIDRLLDTGEAFELRDNTPDKGHRVRVERVEG